MYHANVAATLAMLGLEFPLVWAIRQSLYDLAGEKRMTRLVIKVGALLSCRPRNILYNSLLSSRQHATFGYDETKTLLIPNGFDTSVFKPDEVARARIRADLAFPVDAFLIGLVARVHPVKDHTNFLLAARLFANTCPKAAFVLVGDGADSDNQTLLTLVCDLGLQDRVRLCGSRSDIAAIDAALDIASSSSWGEAFPNAIAEAMACGVPCVATDVGDVSQIIGDTGVVVPARDAPALAAGWAQLAALDASARHALGKRARQRIIERYSLQTMSNQYADLYQSLIKQG
jgi:glycosyltransferase involved in cell wall biosynthesis